MHPVVSAGYFACLIMLTQFVLLQLMIASILKNFFLISERNLKRKGFF